MPRALVIGFLLLAAIVMWFLASNPRGAVMAHFDHSCGQYQVLTFGKPVSWMMEYRRLLDLRYGVRVKSMAGCVVSPFLVQYVDGYNSASMQLLREKHGHDIFEECERLAQARERE